MRHHSMDAGSGSTCEQAVTLVQLHGCQLQDAGQGVGKLAGRLCSPPRLVHNHQLHAQHTCVSISARYTCLVTSASQAPLQQIRYTSLSRGECARWSGINTQENYKVRTSIVRCDRTEGPFATGAWSATAPSLLC